MSTLEFSQHLNQYERVLRPFAFNLTKNMTDVEDLLQDTFYRAIINKDKFMEGTNIKAWLFTIMKNIFINNYRKNQKRNVITDGTDNQYILNSTKQTLTNGSERTFMQEEIQKALNSVTKDFTEPFMLYFSGFKYQEIADKLELPLGTVKSRIFFARKEIQSRLKEVGITHSTN